MFTYLIFAALLITPCVLARPENSAQTSLLDGRIIGGTPADINEAPYQVALLLDWFEIGFYYITCGGSLIAEDVVLTAAHCTNDAFVDEWKVRAGSTFSGSGGQVGYVSRIVVNPKYFQRHDYDIALFFLTDLFKIDGVSTGLVPLPAQGQQVEDGSNAFVTGWGKTQEGGSPSSTLMKITIPIVNQDVCSDAYSGIDVITENMICAGNLETGGQGICQYDAGGPLTIDGVLIGITSWGSDCAKPGYPDIWTRVPNFRNWIDTELKIK